MHNALLLAWFQDVIALVQQAVALVVIVGGAVFFLFEYFVSPLLILFVFCDASTVFRWISRRSNPYLAAFFFFGCVVWLIYWFFRLTPVIAQIVLHEHGES